MAVNISATFKKDQKPLNGLADEKMAAALADETKLHEQYVVVALVRPHAIRMEAEDGTRTPTVKFDHIEPLEGEAADAARKLLDAAYQERTGRDPQMALDFTPPGDDEPAGPVSERTRDEWLNEGPA